MELMSDSKAILSAWSGPRRCQLLTTICSSVVEAREQIFAPSADSTLSAIRVLRKLLEEI